MNGTELRRVFGKPTPDPSREGILLRLRSVRKIPSGEGCLLPLRSVRKIPSGEGCPQGGVGSVRIGRRAGSFAFVRCLLSDELDGDEQGQEGDDDGDPGVAGPWGKWLGGDRDRD